MRKTFRFGKLNPPDGLAAVASGSGRAGAHALHLILVRRLRMESLSLSTRKGTP